jgi:hypothetical protein
MELMRLQQSNWLTTIRVLLTEAQKRKPEAFVFLFTHVIRAATRMTFFLDLCVAPQAV